MHFPLEDAAMDVLQPLPNKQATLMITDAYKFAETN